MIVYAVNSYVERLLKVKLDWSNIPARSGGHEVRPIIPSQQVPEVMNGGKPFAVYMYSEEYNSGVVEPVGSTIITYAIYGTDIDETNNAVQLLFNAFKAEDSADNINSWIFLKSDDLDILDQMDRVTYTQSMNADGAGPTDSEGGRHLGVVQVRIGYVNRVLEDFAL